MHKKIYEHELFLDESNLNLLKELNYVFIALDNGTAKKVVFDFWSNKIFLIQMLALG